MALDEDGRLNSVEAKFAKLGFANPKKAALALAEYPELLGHSQLIDEFGLAADPDLALSATINWFLNASEKLQRLWLDDAGARNRWLTVVGSSEAFGLHCAKHAESMSIFLEEGLWKNIGNRSEVITRLLNSVEAEIIDGRFVAKNDDEATLIALRIAYRTEVIALAIRDLCEVDELAVVAERLSYIADGVIEAALAIAWRSVNPGKPKSELAVIAMGKTGGRELNYISDVDVIYVARPFEDDPDFIDEATRVASRMMQVCEAPTSEGMIWQVDPNLRPEGKAGALVRSLEGHIAYYERWAETWEFQALLKARAMAGNIELGNAYVDSMLPFVWQAAARPNFVSDVQAMRRRVIENIPAREQDRELKLGVGGLRDVEFAVQLLQLVHGRSDVMLRSSNTLQALEALATWGYVGREDASTLAAAYKFERVLEHRIQMYQMRRTHLVPEEESELRRLGRSLGMKNDPAQTLLQTLNRYKLDARRLHEKLFYRPLLQAVVRLDATDQKLSLDAAQERLKALGFKDPESAMRHLAALSSGVSRRASIQKTLLPVMLSWMAQTPNPDAGLLAFRRVSDALGSTPWYLRLLRDESAIAERLSYLLSVSTYFTEMVLSSPESVNLLSDDVNLRPREMETLVKEMQSVGNRHDNLESAISAIRAIRQRELIRISAADLLKTMDLEEILVGISELTEATLAVSLEIVLKHHFKDSEPTLKVAMIGLGKLGGLEMSYASDADATFVYEAVGNSENAAKDALSIISTLQTLLGAPAADPALIIDLDLRPEGKQGAIARSLESYASYYKKWSLTWESQALLRAYFVGGDKNLGAAFTALIDNLRYPADGLSPDELRDIRRIKARVESERLPRGADPATHLKLGPGGISDVEWVAQLMQLQNAGLHTSLRDTSTLVVLKELARLGLISHEESEVLSDAWKCAVEIRNKLVLIGAKGNDSIPVDPNTLKLLAFVLNDESGSVTVERYRRLSRRCRNIMEKYIYGISE
ncbi:MAG: hypothetical protein RLZZ508_1205 [Actinomycetota bacterium]|jgi:glutamate-ammonia-ligase adenylyltransferase